jgi:hypothetical protein
MLAAPPTSTSWRRSSGRTRRVVDSKHRMMASRRSGERTTGVGMFRRLEAENGG